MCPAFATPVELALRRTLVQWKEKRQDVKAVVKEFMDHIDDSCTERTSE